MAQNQYNGGVDASNRVLTCTCSTVKQTTSSSSQWIMYGNSAEEKKPCLVVSAVRSHQSTSINHGSSINEAAWHGMAHEHPHTQSALGNCRCQGNGIDNDGIQRQGQHRCSDQEVWNVVPSVVSKQPHIPERQWQCHQTQLSRSHVPISHTNIALECTCRHWV
jgi:hypothetical protein